MGTAPVWYTDHHITHDLQLILMRVSKIMMMIVRLRMMKFVMMVATVVVVTRMIAGEMRMGMRRIIIMMVVMKAMIMMTVMKRTIRTQYSLRFLLSIPLRAPVTESSVGGS